MKTAISIPDEIFEGAERLARRLKRSRSDLYSRALEEYIARHAPDEITERLNSVVGELGAEGADELVSRAARRSLRRVEW
ncbi:ribbon-helix-helix domain-containing protein [Candidatus Binatia bacterium]|jgi:metal-responsive CopG/Arc/MetJ family transcriptional regulator|nr:ribbon-helix-helix domain-containing protein [Candidatus Binatia bacterium]